MGLSREQIDNLVELFSLSPIPKIQDMIESGAIHSWQLEALIGKSWLDLLKDPTGFLPEESLHLGRESLRYYLPFLLAGSVEYPDSNLSTFLPVLLRERRHIVSGNWLSGKQAKVLHELVEAIIKRDYVDALMGSDEDLELLQDYAMELRKNSLGH